MRCVNALPTKPGFFNSIRGVTASEHEELPNGVSNSRVVVVVVVM